MAVLDPDNLRRPGPDDFAARRHAIRTDMGGRPRVDRMAATGAATIRQRITALLDPGTFEEIGTFARSDRPEDAGDTPGDGKIGGQGYVDGRPVTVFGDDITVKRGSSSTVGSRKIERLFNQAMRDGHPIVHFGETGGARIPDMLGAEGFARITPAVKESERQREVPLVTVIVGSSFGGSSFLSALSDLTIQVEGTCLAVTSPRVIEVATGQSISMEELGSPRIHTTLTGQIDMIAADEDDAIDQVRQFLSYLPSNFRQRPPRHERFMPPRNPDLRQVVPDNRRQTYDMLSVIDGIVDDGSLFELRPLHAPCLVTALARIGGRPVGVIANQPAYQVGVMTPESCDKAVRLICLCDSFGLPLVFLHDTPGFMVGTAVEHDQLLFKAMLLQQAVVNATVPKLAVIVRKSFGLANHVMCGNGMGADLLCAWPGAEISFMDPDVGANVLHGRELEGLTAEQRREKLVDLADDLLYDTSPAGAAGIMMVDEIIDPSETRPRLERALERSDSRVDNRRRLLAGWPMCW